MSEKNTTPSEGSISSCLTKSIGNINYSPNCSIENNQTTGNQSDESDIIEDGIDE